MKKIAFLLCCVALLPACSVCMASKHEGASLETVQSTHTRSQMLSIASAVETSERLPTGELVETYKILKERGSVARAVMHGLLDLSTLGIWEIAGTPIEGSLDKKEYFHVKVTYDKDDKPQKVELV